MFDTFQCLRCGRLYSRRPKKIDVDRGYNKYCTKECQVNEHVPYVGGRMEECFCACGAAKDRNARQCASCYREWIPPGVKPRDEYERRNGIIAKSRNRVSAAIEIGCTPLALAKYLRKYSIDTSHFSHQPKGTKATESIFVDRTETAQRGRNGDLRRIVLDRGLLEYRCKCGNSGWHEGQELKLELDHVNGNPLDDRLENLRFLCPNCHSQTPTYAWKNIKAKRTGQTIHDVLN